MQLSDSEVFPASRQLGSDAPVMICLLGDFRLIKACRPVPVRGGGKIGALLSVLALRYARPVPRETLLALLWPEGEPTLAGQSLNSLVYSLHKLLGDVLGAAPVLVEDGCYRLNLAAGVAVDVARFDSLAAAGHQHYVAGRHFEAAMAYSRAVDLYQGDLCLATDLHAIVERERLRASYLNVLARLADHHFAAADYGECLALAQRLLANDPCREDAHRLIMRCYVRRGERAQALRQYRLCEHILRSEFDAPPEPATIALFDRVRLDPASA